MRVVMLSGYPFAVQRYGVAEHVFRLCMGLGERGHAVRVVSMHSTRGQSRISRELEACTVARWWPYYLSPLSAASAIVSLAEAFEADLVHLHGATIPYAFAAIRLARHLPLVLTLHADVLEESRYKPLPARMWALGMLAPLERLTVKSASRVILAWPGSDRTLKLIGSAPVHVVLNGVSASGEMSVSIRDTARFSYVLFLGALEKRKGPELLIRALSLAARKGHPLKLLVAGDGSQRHELQRLVHREGLDGQVQFLGFVSGTHKAKIIANASVLALPSTPERFQISALEAMALGVPVVSFKAGRDIEFVKHGTTSYLVEEGDLVGFADALVELSVREDLRTELGRGARTMASKFPWTRTVDETVDVYALALGNKGLARHG